MVKYVKKTPKAILRNEYCFVFFAVFQHHQHAVTKELSIVQYSVFMAAAAFVIPAAAAMAAEIYV